MSDPRLTTADRHVGLTLSIHMDLDGGSCYPSIRLLAQECRRNAHTITAAIGHLEQLGYLEVERAKKTGRHGWSPDVNNYTAQLPIQATAVQGDEAPAVAYPVTGQWPREATELLKSSESALASAALSFNETDWMDS